MISSYFSEEKKVMSSSRGANLYGKIKSFERFDKLDCSKIKAFAKENLFSLGDIEALLCQSIDFTSIKNLDFIPTDEAKIRIAQILLAEKAGIHLLISGPTSSAKTFSVLAAFQIFKENDPSKKLVRKNLSEDSTRDDIIGSICYNDDENKFIFQPGPFTEAFKKGYWILLDELSLAPPSVLQSIEAALDSGRLTVQEIGGTREINMNENFFLVCTMNPNSDEYSRFNIQEEFLDRFLCLHFDNLSEIEMKKILKQKCPNENNYEFMIKQIVKAHSVYSCKNMYTLREMDRAAILLNKTHFIADKIIDILYRTRAGDDLKTYNNDPENPFENLDSQKTAKFNYGKLAYDCLKAGFNIILESEINKDISKLAEAIAKKFNKDKQPLIMTMTNELHVSDITEFSVPYTDDVFGRNDLKIKVKKGIFYKAMTEGRIVIINNLEQGNTRVVESLNDIFDCNVLYESTINFKRIDKIHEDFRIIFILHSNVPHKLSAAFLNRFVHIKVLNDYVSPYPIITDQIDIENQILTEICEKEKIACTNQVKNAFIYIINAINSNKNICFCGDSGFGKSLGVDLCLKTQFSDSKVHTIYCNSEISINSLVGKYVFEGKLEFKPGPLLQAAINGDIVFLKNIDQLSFHVFSCIETIIKCSQNKEREFIIPGFDLSDIKVSENIHFIATIDGTNIETIPHYIRKLFACVDVPVPQFNDYEKISKLYNNHDIIIKALNDCFYTFYESGDNFDTSFRMFVRTLSSLDRLTNVNNSNQIALNLFALFQNAKNTDRINKILALSEHIEFDRKAVEDQLKSEVTFDDPNILKGVLKCRVRNNIDLFTMMSKEQLNVAFYLLSCDSPILLVGPTSFKETLIKIVISNDISVFYSTEDTTISDLIGSTTLKKNDNESGKFGYGEVYDMLVCYLISDNAYKNDMVNIDPRSKDAIENLLNNDDKRSALFSYYKQLFTIATNESSYDTIFELGFLIRELLMGKRILIKNVDQLSKPVIDCLLPFLNHNIDLNTYIPETVFHSNSSLFFTCSEQGYSKLPKNFLSRVQTVHIGTLEKKDLINVYYDEFLINEYDNDPNHDYSDIMQAINTLKIARVLGKCHQNQEKIKQARNIINQNWQFIDSDESLFGKFNVKKTYSLDELVKYDTETFELTSLRTGVKIKVECFDTSCFQDIIFVPCLAYLLDLCIISLATNIPLIVESSPGQGKSTLIQRFAKAIKKDSIVTNMSKNRSIEEFVGHIVPNVNGFSYQVGDIYKYIEKDVFYIIDEINLGSSSLLSQFLNVFKLPYQKSISHPHDGKLYQKKFHLFATMNPAILSSNRSYLPHGFNSCSIVCKMPNYTDYDNAEIIFSILKQFETKMKDFQHSLFFIVECHKKCMEKSDDVTIRDILKLAEIFEKYNDKLITKEDVVSNVQIIYSSKIKNWAESFDDMAKKILNVKSVEKLPKTITKQEFKLINQLEQALKMNRGIIIRGPSGCGKSYSISKVFNVCKIKGQKMHVIQLCPDTDISELFGRLEPSYSDHSNLVSNLKKEISLICEDEKLATEIRIKLQDYNSKLAGDKKASDIIKLINDDEEIMGIRQIQFSVNEYIEQKKNKIDFHYQNSPLIEAMINGDWVILDNINLCSHDILESLNSLLEESHTLRITKGFQDVIYSMFPNDNMNNVETINANFRLIMTSDDRESDNFHILPAPFLSRCIVLHMDMPDINELPKIARSRKETSVYANFWPKCLIDDKKNQTRNMNRIIQTFKYFKDNGINREYSIGKALKFILGSNYAIPKSFILSDRDESDDIMEILAIIQTNLFDDKLDDDDFSPLTVDYIRRSFLKLVKFDQENEIMQHFWATFKLSCFTLSHINLAETKNRRIGEKLITLFTCGYLCLIRQKAPPDFMWNLHFNPSIWDFLFITKDKYDENTSKETISIFIKDNISVNENLSKEVNNFFHNDVKDLEQNLDEYINEIMNNSFDQWQTKQNDLFHENKQNIQIENLPLLFPCIQNSQLLKDRMKYSNLIELLNYFNIYSSYRKIMPFFNFDLSNFQLAEEFSDIFGSKSDKKISLFLENLLHFDLCYQCIKKINENDLFNDLNEINMKPDDLNDKIVEMENLILNTPEELVRIQEKMLNVITKAKTNIERAYNSQKTKDSIYQGEKEILIQIQNMRSHIRNPFIDDIISNLMNKNIDQNLLDEVQEWILFDGRIMDDDSYNFIGLNIDSYERPIPEICDKLRKSILITSFIVPAYCESFKIPKIFFSNSINLNFITNNEIMNYLTMINGFSLNKENENYDYLGEILKNKEFEPISFPELNILQNLSELISNMKSYKIYLCIAQNIQAKLYIKQMLQNAKLKTIMKNMEHLTKNVKNEIIKQYKQYINKIFNEDDEEDYHEDDNDEKHLKKYCTSIPPEDWGTRSELKFFENNFHTASEKISFYLTTEKMKKLKIERKPIKDIKLNKNMYNIIPIENLYINYIYLKNLEMVENSLAQRFGYINYWDEISELKTPDQFLKKDIIIFLSKLNEDNIGIEEIQYIKDATYLTWKKYQLDICNIDLHILYSQFQRSSFMEFQRKTKNQFQNEDFYIIDSSIRKLSFEVHSTISKIRNNFLFLLYTANRKDQYQRENCSPKSMQNTLMNTIKKLANTFLAPVNKYSEYDGQCIMILSEGEYFYKIYGNKKDLHKKYKDAYIFELYDDIPEEDKIYEFFQLQKEYDDYKELLKNIKKVQEKLTDFENLFDIEELLMPFDQKNQLKPIYCELTAKIIDLMKKHCALLSLIGNKKIEIPLITFKEINEPFYATNDILMLVCIKGKIQFLHEIKFSLGDCLSDSILTINIINSANASIRKPPNTIINQKNDLLMLTTKITNDIKKFDLIDDKNHNVIGSIEFDYNIVEPDIYLLFSVPVTIIEENNQYSIKLNGDIFHHFSISIFSNVSIISHVLYLNTLEDSEITENFVQIENTNQQIHFTFYTDGIFNAKVKLYFPKINKDIYIKLDLNVHMIENTSIFNAETLKELKPNDKMIESAYYIVKSSEQPFYNNKNTRLLNDRVPYLHLIYTDNKSRVQAFTSKYFDVIESFYPITIYEKLVPKLSDFTINPIGNRKNMYFIMSNQDVILIEKQNNDLIVEFIFNRCQKLEYIIFSASSGNHKNYSKNGIIISDSLPVFMSRQIEDLKKQIKITQNIQIDESTNEIPWILILRLFETSIDEFIEKESSPIIEKLKIRNNQTYYVLAKQNEILPLEKIPDSILNKKIKQTIIASNEMETDFTSLESINYRNVFEIINHLDEIKLAFQFYRQIYKQKHKLAIILSNIFRILEWYIASNIMVDTFKDVYSIGSNIFKEKKNSSAVEIINDDNKESSSDIKFKYPILFKKDSNIKKEKQKDDQSVYSSSKDEENIKENEKNNIPINRIPILKPINSNNNKIFNTIYKILSSKEKEQSQIKENDSVIINEVDQKNNSKNKAGICGKSFKHSKNGFDESQLPKDTLEISKIQDDDMHNISSIEEKNDNLFLQNDDFIEDELPDFSVYIINILARLSASKYDLSLPENHITLLFDISHLSGKAYKNMLAMNMMVTLQILNVFGIKFSVWMFADRNLCFCLKKPSDNLQKDRLTLIRDAYYLDRINPESDVLSAIYKVHKYEDDSSLYIVFSTFISAQILYEKEYWWQSIATKSINQKKLIGMVEPYQFHDDNVDSALEKALIETPNISLIKFDNICNSMKELLLKIFEFSDTKTNQSKNMSHSPLNISFHKFNEQHHFDDDMYVFKYLIDNRKPKVKVLDKNALKEIKINEQEQFEIITTEKDKFGNLKFSFGILYPNKSTKYELTSHGTVIDSQGLIKAYFSNFTNMNIFKQKTGDKKREYYVDILVDASIIMKNCSLDHCFLLIVSLLDAIKELEIPFVNLVIAGSSIIPFLINKDLRYLSKNDTMYSKLYSILYEKASEMRSLTDALEMMISHSVGDSIPHVMFVITDALLGDKQENEIKNLLSFIQIGGTTVIGIGTGPTPYRIRNIFSWSVWSKNPYKLREALFKLSQLPVGKDEFKQSGIFPIIKIPQKIPDFKERVKNLEILKQFSEAEFIRTEKFIRKTINEKAFDPENLEGNYLYDDEYDAFKNNSFSGYGVLVMMFYQGNKGKTDESISKEVFVNGPKDNPNKIKSPGQKLSQKGFYYKIVTTYTKALEELGTGKYCIAMLCTASIGEEKNKEDQNYLIPFLEAIKQFYLLGGALILFGENPPFIFEINLILDMLPDIKVRLDPCFRSVDPGGEIMEPSQSEVLHSGEFINCKYKFKAKINGVEEEFRPFSGGLKQLFEGRTLAKFLNLEIDKSFRIFSITHNGEPSCIFRIPKGKEGVIFIDTGCSKLFNEYTKRGASRYISNMVCTSVHYSNLRNTYTGHNTLEDTGIKVKVHKKPKPPVSLFKHISKIYPPLIISLIIDATGSMWGILNKCINLIKSLLEECKSKANEVEIFSQFVYYRDLSDEGKRMCDGSGIQSDPLIVKKFMSNTWAYGGGNDGPENISAGIERALFEIESFQENYKLCRNVLLIIGDAPNQDKIIPESNYPFINERGEAWKTVWKNIDAWMMNLQIDQVLTISCGREFEKQFEIWKNYKCQYILSILRKKELEDNDAFGIQLIKHVSDNVSSMYTAKKE